MVYGRPIFNGPPLSSLAPGWAAVAAMLQLAQGEDLSVIKQQRRQLDDAPRKRRPTHEEAKAAVAKAESLRAAGAGNRAVLVAARQDGMGSGVGYRPHASTREQQRRAKQIARGILKVPA